MTHRLAAAGFLASVLLAGSTPATAQQRSTLLDDAVPALYEEVNLPPVQADTTVAPVGTMVAAGIVGGAIGFFAGGYGGFLLETGTVEYCADFCGLTGALIGATVGESIGLATGVHLANRRQGTWIGNATLMTALALGGGLLAISLESSATAPILVLTPVAQLIIAPIIEAHSARSRRAH